MSRDTGSGISPEHLAKIFEPFFTTKDGGQGHGSWPVRWSMVSSSRRAASSSAIRRWGKGTTFRIFLPRHILTAEEVAAETTAKVAPKKEAADHTGAGVILLGGG